MNEMNYEWHRPWLIQRCMRKPGSKLVSGQKFSDVLELDYMGSAEFEFGQVPACLRYMHSRMPLTVAEVQVNDKKVWIVAPEERIAPMEAWMVNGATILKKKDSKTWAEDYRQVRLKEHIHFWEEIGVEEKWVPPKRRGKKDFWMPKVEELWLDILNGVAFSLNMELASLLPNLLTGSVNYMNSKTEAA